MEQFISKSAVVEEIEKRKKSCAKQREDMLNLQCYTLADDALTRIGELNCIQDFLDTLEVKEVDLKKEIEHFTMSKELYEADSVIKAVAEHFFELGLKARGE